MKRALIALGILIAGILWMAWRGADGVPDAAAELGRSDPEEVTAYAEPATRTGFNEAILEHTTNQQAAFSAPTTGVVTALATQVVSAPPAGAGSISEAVEPAEDAALRQARLQGELKRQCRTNLAAIVWAANVWCGVNREMHLPLNFMLFTNELSTPLWLVCPADPDWPSRAKTDWNDFRWEWNSYHFVWPNARGAGPEVNVSAFYLRCRFHKDYIQLSDRPSPPGGWGVWWRSLNQ
jgi:hypothetical protein